MKKILKENFKLSGNITHVVICLMPVSATGLSSMKTGAVFVSKAKSLLNIYLLFGGHRYRYDTSVHTSWL